MCQQRSPSCVHLGSLNAFVAEAGRELSCWEVILVAVGDGLESVCLEAELSQEMLRLPAHAGPQEGRRQWDGQEGTASLTTNP